MASHAIPPIDPRDLILDEGVVHLQAGGEAPLPRAALDAFARYARDKAGGIVGRPAMERCHDTMRRWLATRMGIIDAEQVAFTGSASTALSAAIAAIDWREGDNVVTLADEFPSVVLAPLALRRFGVTLRVVEGGNAPEQALADASDSRTRVACVSHVSFRHGRRLDLEQLSSLLSPMGAALFVDASHSLGVLDVPVSVCDVLVSCAHKFLLGPHGIGVLWWNPRRLGSPRPEELGWFGVEGFRVEDGVPLFSAKRAAQGFEPGNPNFGSLYALRAGLELLERSGAAAIERHAMDLSTLLRRRLVGFGLHVLTPEDPAKRGTSIAVAVPDSDALAGRLAEHGVLVASGEGRIRLSIHGFNTEQDVEAALAAIHRAYR